MDEPTIEEIRKELDVLERGVAGLGGMQSVQDRLHREATVRLIRAVDALAQLVERKPGR